MSAKPVPRRLVDNYSRVLDTLEKQAMSEAAEAFGKINYGDIDAARTATLAVMQSICGSYAQSAASVAARFYEAARRAALGVDDYRAVPEANRAPEGTRIAVLGIMKKFKENGDAESLVTQLLERIGWEIRHAADEAMEANMLLDPYKGE